MQSWRTWMIGRPAARQCVEQGEAVGVDAVVPAARPAGLVEASLHVDGQEHGAVEIEGHVAPIMRARPGRLIKSRGCR